jgi:prepilin peptidase CpaA
MNLLASAPGWLTAILLLLMLMAALEDAWRMEIADWTNGAVAASALAAVAVVGPAGGLWQNMLLCAAVLGVGTLLFQAGGMGGGDVKLMAASALWFDLSSGWKLFVLIAMVGGVETLILLGLRKLPWSEATRTRHLPLRQGEGIPYGIAIAVGVALACWWFRR